VPKGQSASRASDNRIRDLDRQSQMPNVVNVPAFDGTARHVADVWRLTEGDRTAVCSFWTHPIGGEIRLDVDGEMSRTEAGRDGNALLDVALDWREQFEGKGWS
jgi:hypothetical protein